MVLRSLISFDFDGSIFFELKDVLDYHQVSHLLGPLARATSLLIAQDVQRRVSLLLRQDVRCYGTHAHPNAEQSWREAVQQCEVT